MIAYSATDTGSFFYTKIYKLAVELYNKMDLHCMTFPGIPKPSSRMGTIHKIGQWIASKWICYKQADVYNIGNDVGFMDLIQRPEYGNFDHYFVLTQSSTWGYLFDLYGV